MIAGENDGWVDETPVETGGGWTDEAAVDYAGKLKGLKKGDLVAVSGRDGKVSLKKMNAPVDGASVLEDVDGEPETGRDYPTLTADEWDAARENGDVRMNVSPSRYRRLQQIAETGSDDLSAFRDTAPFIGRAVSDDIRHMTARMERFVKGDPDLSRAMRPATAITPFPPPPGFKTDTGPKSESEAWGREAEMLGVKAGDAARRDGEDDAAYRERLIGLVREQMEKRVSRQDRAKRELSYIEKDWKDTVFGEGRQSVGYGLEFAMTPVPLGGLFKAGKAAPWLVRAAGRVARAAVETAPVAITHAASDYERFRENGYTMRDGHLEVESKGDDPGTALWKAIKSNEAEAILEVVGGDLAAPVLRQIGKAIGRNAVGKVLVGIGRRYGKIRDLTHFGDPIFEENLFEEMPQYFFSDILGWGKKDSEYRGFHEELANAFGYEKRTDPETGAERYEGSWLKGEGMYTPKGFWNTSLAMLLQMGGQAALASGGAGLGRIRDNRDLANKLEGAGMTKEQVANLSHAQREAFKRFHDHFADNPEKLKEALTRFDRHFGEMADELVKQTTYRTEQSVKEYGQMPHRFQVQSETGPDGKPRPKFDSSVTLRGDGGSSGTRRQMFDPVAQVSIEDYGDGTYCVHDEAHPDRSAYAESFVEALHTANLYSLTNQKKRLDNERKREYARVLTEGGNAKYGKPAVFVDGVRDVYSLLSNAIRNGGGIYGINARNIGQVFQTGDGEVLYPPRLVVGNTSRGFTTPDGTKVVILDNIRSPADMNTVLSHEAGHAAGRADQAERLEMLRRASPGSEVGRLIAQLKARNEELGNKFSEAQVLDEAFSIWLSKRGHNPSLVQRLSHRLFGKAGQLNDADFEVIASQIEKGEEGGSGENVHFFESGDFDSTVEPAETAPEAIPTPSVPEGGTVTPPAAPEADTGEKNGTPEAPTGDTGGANPLGEPPPAAPETTSKPVSERTIVEKLTDRAPVQELPVAEVVNDDKRIPNFKEGADPETGEVEPLTGEPYDLVSNPIVVMEFKDGKKVVVTGRHRLALYRRAGRATISARVIREADGWTVDDAKAIDAIGNIIDEKGSVKDYVNYFNNAKPTRDEAKAGGFLDRPKGQRAFGIFEGATEDTKSVIDWNGTGGDGLISVDQAGIIAEAAPKQAGLQRILVRKALDGLRGKKLAVLARSLAEEAKSRRETPSAGGETQLDLFTSEEDQNLLALEERRADYRVRRAGEYARIAEVLRTALAKGGKLDLNADYAKELGITDPDDKKQLAAARDKAAERASYWENAVRLDDADKAAMDAEINAAADARAKRLAGLKARREAAKGGKPAPKPKAGTPAPEPVGSVAQPPSVVSPAPEPDETAPVSAPPKAAKPAKPSTKPGDTAEQGRTEESFLAPMTPFKRKNAERALHRPVGRGETSKFDGMSDATMLESFVGRDDVVISAVPHSRSAAGGGNVYSVFFKGENNPESITKTALDYARHLGLRIEDKDPADAWRWGENVEYDGTPVEGAPVRESRTTETPPTGRESRQVSAAAPAAATVKITPPDNYSFQSSKGRQRWIERMNAAWTKMLEVVKPGETVGLSELYYRTGLPRSDIDDALQLKDPIAGKRWEAFNDFTSFTYTRPAIEPSNKNAPAKPAPVREGQTTEKPVAKPREPSIKMKDEAAEKLARQQEDDLAALFDTPELDAAQLEADSKRFDDELQRQIDGTLPDGHVYQMGRPGAILRSTGVPDLPIQLSAMRLKEKSLYNRHPFELGDVKGLVKALQTPVAVFSYGDKSRAQNIIVEITSNGKNFLVGLSLNPEVGGRVLNVNSIRNVFPKDTVEWLHWIEQGKLLYADKQKVQDLIDQQRMTFADVEYLDLNRVRSILDSFTNPQAENSQNAGVDFDTPELAIRKGPPPKKTGIGYKVFAMKDGKLYPPMVANPGGMDTLVGVWIDASEGARADRSKTGRDKVKAGGKGTNGGGGTLAWRPGWHLGKIPYALQFNIGPKVPNPLGIKNKRGKVIKVGEFFPSNFVWAEVEYAADVDYQEEAMSYGRTASGKFQHSLAGLPRIPVDGSYEYRTNANPATDPWIITGSMKVNRVLSNEEVDAIVRGAGRQPQKRETDVVQKFLAWTKKWKLDPSKDSVREEWKEKNGVEVSFDTPDFDPDVFQKRVGAVAKLVKTYRESGVADFGTLATRMAERFPGKFAAMKPFLRGVWNAVAEQMDLPEVSRGEAENVYGTIGAQTKETGNERLGQSGQSDGNGDRPLDSVQPEQDTAAAEGTEAGKDGAPGSESGTGVRVQGEAGLEGRRVGSRPGGRDSDAGGADNGTGDGSRREQAGNAAGEGGRASGDRSGTGRESTRGESGGLHPDGGGRERDSQGGPEGSGADVGGEPRVRVKKAAKKAADATKPNPQRRDFAMTAAVEEAILEKSAAARVKNNLDAIRLIRALKARDYAATPEEQAVLAKFVGWGGLREKVFGWDLERAYDLERSGDAESAERHLKRSGASRAMYELHRELRSVLNDAEYESAKESASTAFYTPVEFVRVLHGALRALGVKGGRFLGPSAGTGNFASAAGEYEKPVNWHFVEKDAVTGEMLKALFPNQRVTVGGFEDTKFPDGFFDFAIDNVPYADVPVNDRSLSSRMFKIHDYFFAKTLSKLRPGGVMAFLTSTGTLDKTSPALRQFLSEHGGRIVGAVRLPNGFFSENAGTDVASDLVIVQKVDGRPDNSAFGRSEAYKYVTGAYNRKTRQYDKTPVGYNGYFKDNPGQVVGEMKVENGRFGPELKYGMPEGGVWDRVREAVGNALAGIDRDALLKNAAVAEKQDHAPIYDAEGLRQGNVALKDGKPYIKSGETLEPLAFPNDRGMKKELARRMRTPAKIMEGLIALRKAMRDVIDAQMSESDTVEADLAPLWAKLNEVYDAFVKKNGSLHDKWITPFVLLDRADGNRMLALERVVKDADGNPKIVKSDIFSKRVISRGQRAAKADTPKDALVISYSETGTLSVPRIAELLGVNEETAVAKLKEGGDAFENPQTGRLEPSWEYLSGRVRAKLAAARAAVAAGEESYRTNVEALEKVQPPMVRLEDAEIKFGATWVDPECMKDFLRDAFGSENMRVKLVKNEVTGQWNVEFERVINEDPWGRTSWPPVEFISRVLNHGSMNHYETDPVDKKRYLNERQTEANKLAAEKLHHAFSQFIQSSEKWAVPMYERYNAVMTDMVEIRLPNNILPFRAAGMSEATLGKLFEGGDPDTPKKGREYQSAVIARGVLGGSSLCLAHCVGAGKTLEMQSIGVLGRHLGLFKKPMYVVPNHMLEQFVNEFVEAFPNANILKMSESDVKPENRRAFFAQVSNGDWDAIVVKHSTFSQKLGMSDEYQKEFIEAQKRDLEEAIAAMREAGERISVDQATKKLERLKAKLEQLANAENHDSQIVPFEELGVDQLFVDEAHNFKGMPITTRQGRTGGLSQGDSQRAVDMQMKTQYVQSLHGGDRGVVFATGTPLSNAPVVEAYVMLKYLAPGKLEEQGLTHFDDFVDAFGRITTESIFSEDGKSVKEKDMISGFVNIPELMKLFRSVVDIVNQDQLDIPRPKPKYHMIDVGMTEAQRTVMESVAREAGIPASKEWRNKYMDLTWVAKYACLSPKMLGIDELGNKVLRVVSEVKRVYDETSDNRGAQLIFTDRFEVGYEEAARRVLGDQSDIVGHISFNLNKEIKDLLVQSGIPSDEIAIIQDIDKSKGDKDENKEALFTKVRAGEVRVLIGSRPKMGEGTNVQERLAAIHLLHPGWKPAEDEQAIGRIIRYGNTYKEGHIFYYLTSGNDSIGSYETKNHQLIGVKSKLIDQVMHGDETIREIDTDESAINRDMLMGLASGNKALMELIDVKKRVHKLELNTESTMTSARRNKDRAEANSRILERKREEFARGQEGAREWREKNAGKPFALSTPDGRSLDKVKDMAEHVAGEMTRLLTKDRYDRDERTVLGDFNGVELVLAYDKWGGEKFTLAVPLLGVAREIGYSGFIPDFTTAAMTAFKGRLFEAASPDYARAVEAQFADMDRQAKKMSADADRLQKDYEQMRGELIRLRTRQAELEREVTPLVVEVVEDRSVAAYGNWAITRQKVDVGFGLGYSAVRERDGKELLAPTVKELIPLMDAEDFARPKNAATKTIDLHPRADARGEAPRVDKIPAGEVDFDTPELTPAEEEYAGREDKTPTEKDMREVFGMTNDEIATALKAAAMEPPKHQRKPDEATWQQAEALLSNPSYMAKLSRAVAKFPRNIADYENAALNVLFRRRQSAVNAAQSVADALKETLDAFAAVPKEERDDDFNEEQRKTADDYAEAKARLAQAKALMFETGSALTRSSSEAGRRLRSNRMLVDQADYSYAGISAQIADALGGADKITPEMDARIREIAAEFATLDQNGRELATVRLKAQAEKIVEQIKNADKVRRAVERKPSDEARRVTRNYNDALAQIEVGAAEVGGTLVGLSDQQYPAWGRWLRAIGEYHCFANPAITEEECVNAIVEDISPFIETDANAVRDALTGFGHNFRQSRYDSQRLMNDLRSQSRLKRQLDWMDDTNTMPPLTGLVRDEPSDTTRNLQQRVQARKAEIPDAGRDERRLKGVLDSAKTRVRNRIADLERAIETGEKIPARDRTVPEDIELRELKRRRDELKEAYDELFKPERGMTDEQRISLAEKLLARELEHALEDLDRARSGDFSKRPKRPGVTSPALAALRDRLDEVRGQIRELKAAKYEFGMTPEELEAYNARKMANREKAIARLAERVATGDLRPQKKPQPPMPAEMQKRYDELAEQMKKARQKLADIRLDAENATAPTFVRKARDYLRFVTTAQRALRATMDFSAVLRQAARITLAHPVMGAKSFGKAWNAAHSEANLTAVNDEIMSDPSIQEAVAKYGLHLREVDAASDRDVEMFHGMERNKVRIFGREFAITDIPFFGGFMLKSERHYITYLNAVSAELYSAIVNDRTRFPGGATGWQKKMTADMINIWNGSAALSKERRQALQKAWVNDIFWAPQLAISRAQSAALYDVWRPLVAKGVKNAETGGYDAVSPEERKAMFKVGASEHIKSSLAMIALGALLKWLFADDDDWYYFSQFDWFEKLMMLASPKIGNTTIDLTGGEQSINRLAHQIARKEKRSGTGRTVKFGGYGAPTTMSSIQRFMEGKTAPWLSELAALWEGRDYVGNDYTWKNAVMGAVVPLTFEDMKDQLVQNGVGKSLVTMPLSLLGAGGSTYDRKPYENAVNRFLEAKKEYDAIEKDDLIDERNRKLMLDSIIAGNPLMREGVREDIAADIARIRRDEARARKGAKGGVPDADLLSGIETGKARLLEKIRTERRR